MRPGFLGLVAARDVEHERPRRIAGGEVQVARDDRAVPGHIDVLDAVRGELAHLAVAAHEAAVQEALLLVGLEHDVLGVVVLQRRLVVELECRLAVTRFGFGLRQALGAPGRLAHVLGDHVVAAHAARQPAPAIGLEVEDLAGFLDHPVENPLLCVAAQVRPSRLRLLRARHGVLLGCGRASGYGRTSRVGAGTAGIAAGSSRA
jgi:hypothetical protein